MSNHKRRFSLDEDFMKYDTDDLLYGFMRSISTVKPDDLIEYLTIKNFQKEKKIIAAICGVSAQTITRKVNKLLERGLLELGEIEVGDYKYPCYFFPWDYDGVYKIIEQEMIAYLVNTRNSQAIRIYLYLLNCSTYKEDYVFTIKEIKKALGYAETTKSADRLIKDVLESFQKEGLIRYKNEWFPCVDESGKETHTERMVLKFIANSKAQF